MFFSVFASLQTASAQIDAMTFQLLSKKLKSCCSIPVQALIQAFPPYRNGTLDMPASILQLP